MTGRYVLGNIDTIDESPVPMLYQSGYLTIKGYDKEFEMYRLGFPNQEVERGFTLLQAICQTFRE